VASVTRLVGDLATAEDAVQDACLAALAQWPTEGEPANPRAWLIGVARHKALDRIRRDAGRSEKEAAALREWAQPGAPQPTDPIGDDELSLIFMCCHPALDPAARIALTLRSVCGLSTAEVASVFLVGEPTMAKRLGRAKRKIRQAGIPFRAPQPEALADRLGEVLRVVYLIFTEGHMASAAATLVRGELCDTAIRLARTLAALLSDEPEVSGLLSLLLLTDARRVARVDAAGDLVLLDDQDRSRWNQAMINEGEALLERALRVGRPGPYQLHAAIAACHSTAPHAVDTDWRQIALLYGELLRTDPGHRGEPGHRRRDGRWPRRRTRHPRHHQPPPPAQLLAPTPHRPSGSAAPARPQRRRPRRLPHRTPTQPVPTGTDLHRQTHRPT
jgi:RNA polymerase sigma-70 factor (ECF subfamily)